MCGIIFTGSSYTLTANEISLFENLLYMDVIRGVHATGVIAGYNLSDRKQNFTLTAKSAEPAAAFLGSKDWSEISSISYENAWKTKIVKNPHFLVGHNRHATRGAKTAENAHPFTHGNITLVHNGTLTDQSLLPDSTKFEVDSENICHSINTIGAAETIQKLNGAYTLIWHDNENKTLNIIRNEERPFHLAETTLGTWFGASEEDMLMWILTRDTKHSFSKNSPTLKEHFECEIGVQYVFDTKEGQFSLKEKIKHELPVFYSYSRQSYYGIGDGYDYGSTSKRNEVNNFRNKGSDRVKKAADSYLEEIKISERVGDTLWFEGLEYCAYTGNSTQGKIVGWLHEVNEYVEVQSHCFKAEDFQPSSKYSGEIVSAFKMDGVITIIVKNAKQSDKPETKIPLINPPTEDDHDHESDSVLMEDNKLFTVKEWEGSILSDCANCGYVIPFEEAEDARAIQNGYVCSTCVEEFQKEIDEEDAMRADDAPFRYHFNCTMCGEQKDISDESYQMSVCKECHGSFYQFDQEVLALSDREATLDDGSTVTESEWGEMSSCLICSEKIPFEKADHCSKREYGILCFNCCL